MKWYEFHKEKGYRQKRPKVRKLVLVILERTSKNLPRALAVGYMKNSAGQKEYPYFVIPGIGGEVLYWSDCLPSDIEDSLKFYYEENNSGRPQNEIR